LPLSFPSPPPGGSDWCDELKELAAYLIDLGKLILVHGSNGPGVDPCEIVNIALLAWPTYGQPLDWEQGNVKKWLTDATYVGAVPSYINGIKKYLPNDRVDDVTALLAVRAVVQMWQDAAVGWESSGSGVTAGGAHLAPGLLGLGVGINFDKSQSKSYSLHASIKAGLVPLMERIDQCIRLVSPTGWPGIGEAIHLFTHGRISLSQCQCLVAAGGGDWALYELQVQASAWRLSPESAVLTTRLLGGQAADVVEALSFSGVVPGEQQTRFLLGYDRPLTPGECLDYGARDLTNQNDKVRFNWEEGFNTLLWDQVGPTLQAQGITEQTARVQWQQHWRVPEPFMLADWVWRTDAGLMGAGHDTTRADLDRLLTFHGWTKYMRDRFAAAMFVIPSVRQHANSVAFGQYNLADVETALRSAGYRQADVDKLGKAYYYQGIRRGVTAADGFTMPRVAMLTAQQLMTRQQADAYLLPQGYTGQQITDAIQWETDKYVVAVRQRWGLKALSAISAQTLAAYRVGAINTGQAQAALQQAGCPADSAAVLLAAQDLAAQVGTLKTGISAVKHSLLIGAINYAQAITSLVAMGVQQPRASQYATQWQAMLTFPRRAASAAEIQGWATQGILSLDVAAQRLSNLGFNPDDVALKMMAIQAKLTALANKTAAAQQKAALAAAKQAAANQKKAKQLVSQNQAIVRRFFSLGRTTKLYAQGIISEKAFRRRLDQGGYDATEIEEAFREADIAKKALDARTAKAGADTIRSLEPPVE
jgi:hypothetical protein